MKIPDSPLTPFCMNRLDIRGINDVTVNDYSPCSPIVHQELLTIEL
jgi:hypothetical protein